MNASEVFTMREMVGVQFSYELSDLFVDITKAMENVHLTELEGRVLHYIIEGYNYSEIAKITGIHRLAVPNYFASTCQKLVEELGSEYYTKLREK